MSEKSTKSSSRSESPSRSKKPKKSKKTKRSPKNDGSTPTTTTPATDDPQTSDVTVDVEKKDRDSSLSRKRKRDKGEKEKSEKEKSGDKKKKEGEKGEGDKKPEDGGEHKNHLLGISLCILSGLFFAVCTFLVKSIPKTIGSPLVTLFRYFGIILFAFPLLLESKQPLLGPKSKKSRLLLLARGVFGGLSLWMHYEALQYISGLNSTVINAASPAFVFLIAYLVFGEPFGKFHGVVLFLTIIGVAFAGNVFDFMFKSTPDLATTILPDTEVPVHRSGCSNVEHQTSSGGLAYGNALEIGQMFMYALGFIFVKGLANEHPTLVLFDYSFVSFVLVIIINLFARSLYLPTGNETAATLAPAIETPTLPTSTLMPDLNLNLTNNITGNIIDNLTSPGSTISSILNNLVAPVTPTGLKNILERSADEGVSYPYTPYFLFGLGIFAFYGQALGTKANQMEDASVVATMRQCSEVIFAFFGDLIVFRELPSLATIIGTILVIIAACMVSLRKWLQSKPADHPLRQKLKFIAD